MSLPVLNLPPASLEVRAGSPGSCDGAYVYDRLRRKWVALTPEEWVRQNFVEFLVNYRRFQPSLMANEVVVNLNGLSRRCDTVVYDRRLRPCVIVEYKRPSVAVSQRVFDQIARYNLVLRAPWLIVSNGLHHYCCRFGADGSYNYSGDIPFYEDLVGELQK